jgi:UDP-N-acetylmuramyl pentapeptide synthase
MIIDGSYNGGYLSIREGIVSMRSFVHSHRIVFLLGDMRELGESASDIHQRLAHDILDILPHDADVSFSLVGPLM